jgi:hypothetical protein
MVETIQREIVVRRAATKGKLYIVELIFDTVWQSYDIQEYKHGKLTGCACNHPKEYFDKIIADAKKYDNINFIEEEEVENTTPISKN